MAWRESSISRRSTGAGSKTSAPGSPCSFCPSAPRRSSDHRAALDTDSMASSAASDLRRLVAGQLPGSPVFAPVGAQFHGLRVVEDHLLLRIPAETAPRQVGEVREVTADGGVVHRLEVRARLGPAAHALEEVPHVPYLEVDLLRPFLQAVALREDLPLAAVDDQRAVPADELRAVVAAAID